MQRNKIGHVRINATIMRVQVNTLAVEKLYVLHMLSVCVYSLSYAARNAHAQLLYCQLWSVWLYRIFAHFLINDTIFGKTFFNTKCVS